jgi:hypothetical protein
MLEVGPVRGSYRQHGTVFCGLMKGCVQWAFGALIGLGFHAFHLQYPAFAISSARIRQSCYTHECKILSARNEVNKLKGLRDCHEIKLLKIACTRWTLLGNGSCHIVST